ncbi:MAG: hypothetical protein GTN93_23160 [Anaerolineae bacterium]|nr:hypothetical protein [Anaerolineae bacterium]
MSLSRLGWVAKHSLVSCWLDAAPPEEDGPVCTRRERRIELASRHVIFRVLRNKRSDFETFLDLDDELRPLVSLGVLGGVEGAIARLDVKVIVFDSGEVKLQGRFPEDVLDVPATDPSGTGPVLGGLPFSGVLERLAA